jgi:hypothetical protein
VLILAVELLLVEHELRVCEALNLIDLAALVVPQHFNDSHHWVAESLLLPGVYKAEVYGDELLVGEVGRQGDLILKVMGGLGF